jgi:hypothetical protein
MAKKADQSLLLTLSEKEAQALRDIVHMPPEIVPSETTADPLDVHTPPPIKTARRRLWTEGLLLMLIAVLLIAALMLGQLRPQWVAAIAKWVTELNAN